MNILKEELVITYEVLSEDIEKVINSINSIKAELKHMGYMDACVWNQLNAAIKELCLISNKVQADKAKNLR